MTASIANFIATWSPSFNSTIHRVELRNVRQGGNNFLSIVPQGLQAGWAGPVVAKVAEAATGPLSSVAHFFSYILHPLVSIPLSVVSWLVSEKLYESSLEIPTQSFCKCYRLGNQVDREIKGTVTLDVDGEKRHFLLGADITYRLEHTIPIEKNGKKELYYCEKVISDKEKDDTCREVEIQGRKVVLKPLRPWEPSSYVKMTINNEARYYQINNEVSSPIVGTIRVGNSWNSTHHLLAQEIEKEEAGCVKIEGDEQILHYETGDELVEATATSRKFTINGKVHHFASAKYTSNRFSGFSGAVNQALKYFRVPFGVPTRLSRITTKVMKFLNTHMTNIVRITLIVSGVALAIFGQYAMGIGALAAVTYEYLDHDLGIIPQKVSYFMEKYMPIISMVGLLIVGSVTTQVMSIATLLMMIPSVNRWVHQKYSFLMRKLLMAAQKPIVALMANKIRQNGGDPENLYKEIELVNQYPTLEQFDAPLIENRELTKSKTLQILDFSLESFETNPAHFTKLERIDFKLPENRNFDELTRLWDTLSHKWIEAGTYNRLVLRLADDERFIEFLQKTRFSEAKPFYFKKETLDYNQFQQDFTEARNRYRNQVKEWISTLASENSCTQEEYVGKWIRDQLQCFVDKLSSRKPIEGEQSFLVNTMENVSKSIPFLLKNDVSSVELEDALIKLAIEGGNYCSLAMKRASSEVLEGLINPLLFKAKDGAELDPYKSFEKEVRLTLQSLRLRMIQRLHSEISQLLHQREELSRTGNDVHLYTALKQMVSRNFYPMEKEDLDNYTLIQTSMNETLFLVLHIVTKKAYDSKGLPEEVRKLAIIPGNFRKNRILDYLRNWVTKNPAFSGQDRRDLLEGTLSDSDENIADSENHVKWGNLMLYILGIFREKKQDPAPAPRKLEVEGTQRALITATT